MSISIDINGQRILQSKEMTIRNDRFYDIFHFENGRSIVLRDKGNSVVIESFNDKLLFERTVELNLGSNKVNIESVVYHDGSLKVLHTYRDKGNHYLSLSKYDEDLNRIDSTKIFIEDTKRLINGSLKSTLSEDESKTLIFGKSDGEFLILVIDNKKDILLNMVRLRVEDLNLRNDFRKVVISNEGKVFIVFEENNSKYRREKHSITIYESTDSEDFFYTKYDLSNTVSSGIRASYNNEHKHLIVAGLYGNKDKDELVGYFTINLNDDKPLFMEFDSKIYSDLYGKNMKRGRAIRDFYLKQIIHRADGGVLLVSEMIKEFVRRSSYSSMSRHEGDRYSMRGFVDYYNEDIIITSNNRAGNEEWYKVLYKKQFSQDDDGVFSSFFTFLTSNRIRLIYNDEIKKNSTVSEYVISPSGKFERNAVLNTEYKDLRIRFMNAKQIGSNDFIAPSEKNFKLSLVRINI